MPIPAAPPPGLVAAIVRDKDVASCAADAGASQAQYVATAFELRNVTLKSGERMTVAVGKDACIAVGQSVRVFIFRRTPGGFVRVLDDVSMAESVDVRSDGTVELPTHETIDTIVESTYVWNGKTYAFSPARSHVYDVPLEERRPYQIAVTFPPGAHETTLSGSTALNFGETYVFKARAGQTADIALTHHTGRAPAVVLSYGGKTLADLTGAKWTGTLPHSGTYALDVFGSGDGDPTTRSAYTIRLHIN
jgi:hypothetical protein